MRLSVPKVRWRAFVDHWLRPRGDFQELLSAHARLVEDGVAALVAWFDGGGAEEEQRVLTLEDQADEARRQISVALGDAFMTPLDPEDIESLSEQMDNLIDSAKRIVGEMDALSAVADDASRRMAHEFLRGTRALCQACHLVTRHTRAAADFALTAKRTERTMEHIYRDTMHDVFAEPDVREILRRQEVYRLLRDAGTQVAAVADLLRHITSKLG